MKKISEEGVDTFLEEIDLITYSWFYLISVFILITGIHGLIIRRHEKYSCIAKNIIHEGRSKSKFRHAGKNRKKSIFEKNYIF